MELYFSGITRSVWKWKKQSRIRERRQPVRYPPLLIALFLAVLLMPFVSASAIPSAFFMIIVFATVIYAFRHIRGLALT